VDQARALGLAPSHIFQVSGMILNPRFHQPPAVDRARELTRLGLDPARPTGIVMFGGEGSMEMVKIAKALNPSDVPLAKQPGREPAVLTGGCFWGMQTVFHRVRGVLATTA
ncbi:MAG: peptide-methionine (S)-S-oxide reductase, partial [Bryobacteraceae bacterium]